MGAQKPHAHAEQDPGGTSMLKRILIGAGALILLLVAVVIGRTLMVPTMNLAEAGKADSIDAERAAQHLAEAVRFETISHQRGAKAADIARSKAAFEGFRNWMDETYPAFTAATSREIVGGATLFYTWEGTDTSLDPVLLMSHIDVVPIAPGTANMTVRTGRKPSAASSSAASTIATSDPLLSIVPRPQT